MWKIHLFGWILLTLLPCPDSPNCVSSQADKKSQYVQPFPVITSPEKDIELIAVIIQALPRSEIIEKKPLSLHAVFRSKVFKFKDDVEFIYDEKTNQIDVKSAARSGYYDFGVNRKRVNTIREKYLKNKTLL